MEIQSAVIARVLLFTFLLLPGCSRTPQQQPPLVLLGIDGASWKFMDPLLERGELPTFKRLIHKGVRGHLETLLPTQSVIIWNSIVTGCLPEKHGIKGWLSGAGNQLAITSTMRQKPALWDILSSRNRKGFYINWWSSWPVYPLEGVMVSNLFFYKDTPNPVYPPELTSDLRKRVSRLKRTEQQSKENLSVTNTAIYRKDELVFSLTEELLDQESYDVMGVYVRGLDMIEHEHYRDSFPEEFPDPPQNRDKKKDFIDDYYIELDGFTKKLLARFKGNVDVIIVSDHGMEAMKANPPPIIKFLMNELLQELGYLEIKNQYDLDWSVTKAYQYGYHIPGPVRKIRINMKDREPEGIVPEGDRESMTHQVMEQLTSLKVIRQDGLQDEEPLFTSILAGKDDEADIVCHLNLDIEPNDILKLPRCEKKVDRFLTHFLVHLSGQHDAAPPGIVILSGPSFASGLKLTECHVTDIVPTILQVLGLPVSEEMDGRVLLDALGKTCRKSRILTVQSYPLPEGVTALNDTKKDLPPTVEKEIREDLQSLGYIQ